ncbi:MAG: hypothetical protein LBK92_05025 [Endomicrobium sp.]|nr:hypothetical protein [Endomicrobium sp.]
MGQSINNFSRKIWGLRRIGIVFFSVLDWIRNAVRTGIESYKSENIFKGILGAFSPDESIRKDFEKQNEFIKNLSEKMGLSRYSLMENQSQFASMLQGFGIPQKFLGFYSQLLTSFGLVLTARTPGQSIEEVMEGVKDALSNRLEKMYSYGIDSSRQKINEFGKNPAINKTYAQMGRDETSYMRFIAMLDVAEGSLDSFFKNMSSGTMQFEIFNSKMRDMAAEVYRSFLPALVSILPVIYQLMLGFANTIKWIGNGFKWLAGIFHLKTDWDFSPESDSTRAIKEVLETNKDISKELGEETKNFDKNTNSINNNRTAIDKLNKIKEVSRRATKNLKLGFDELNIIKPNNNPIKDLDEIKKSFDFTPPKRMLEFMEKMNEGIKNHTDKFKEAADSTKWVGDLTENISKLLTVLLGFKVLGFLISTPLKIIGALLGKEISRSNKRLDCRNVIFDII